MKISKKLVVSSLSTAAALSFVAALSGTLAWFQYNTRVSTTIIGTGVAETGALQISADQTNWKRDLVTEDLIGEHIDLKPVTFGAMNLDGSMPAKAYMKPDASENWKENDSDYTVNDHTPGSYADVYQEATVNEDYIQYSVYIRALQVDNVAGGEKQVVKDVYLSNILFADIDGEIASGLRAHLAIDSDGNGDADKFYLISKNEVKNLKLSGVLDLDGNDKADKQEGPEWNASRDKMVIYGNDGEFQNTIAADDLKVTRVNNSIDGKNPENMKKKLFTTLADKNVKVTVTLWLEGWDTSIGEGKDVEASELLWQKASYLKPVSAVNNYYQLVDGKYVKEAAEAKAVDGKNYFDLVAEDLELNAGDAIPAGSFIKDGDDYKAPATAFADGVETYYAVYAKSVDNLLVYPAALTAELAKTYVDDAQGNKIKCTETAADCDLSKQHYLLANTGEFYAVKELRTIQDEPVTASGQANVNGLYTKDANGNCIKASGVNDIAETYYEFTNAGQIKGIPMWSGENTDGAQFRFGLTFDVGADAFEK